MSTIFVRERRKAEKGEKKPRFRVVATVGDVKIFAEHVRKLELEAIAKHAKVEVIYLEHDGEGKGGGKEE